jgi:hypothetical protein
VRRVGEPCSSTRCLLSPSPSPSRLLLPAMAGLLELVVPSNGSEYTSIEDITFALYDWAVKEKFSFRRAKSSGVSWVCATREQTGCQWKVRGEVQKRWRIEGEEEEEGQGDDEEARLYTLVIVHSDHQCHGNGVKTHRSSSSHEWLDGTVARHMRVTRDTKPSAIVDMLKVQFLETISDKVAQLCKQRLLKSDLTAQRESFKLIPAYERRLQEVSPNVYTDLQINQNTGKYYPISSSILLVNLILFYRSILPLLRCPSCISRMLRLITTLGCCRWNLFEGPFYTNSFACCWHRCRWP